MFKILKIAYNNNKEAIRIPLMIAVGLELTIVGLLYLLNQVRGHLYDALPLYDSYLIWANIVKFATIAFLLVIAGGYLGFYLNKLSFFLREGLTKAFFFISEPKLNEIGRPEYLEQRVQEDFKRFGEQIIDLVFTILKSILNLIVFIGLIISLTKWWIGLGIVVAVVGGTILTKVIGNPLVRAQSVQENNEAAFRKNLYSLGHWKRIKEQFKITNMLYKRMSFTQSGLSQAFGLLPFIVLLPMYISKALTMGAFMQSVEALGRIVDALSVIIDNRQTIVNIQTCLIRISFMSKIED